jgi:hypothetical protein
VRGAIEKVGIYVAIGIPRVVIVVACGEECKFQRRLGLWRRLEFMLLLAFLEFVIVVACGEECRF